MDLQIDAKVALVTGGSRGLGRAICLALAAEGANVAVGFRRDATRASAVVREVEQLGSHAIAVYGDVSCERDASEIFRHVQARLSPIDILVNNAGVWPTASVEEMSCREWQGSMATNLTGTFLTSREAARCWVNRGSGGCIVNISSSAAFLGATSGHAHYAANKAAVVSLTVSLARELASHGIRVNAVAAGMMRTDMTLEALRSNAERYLNRIPLRRIADPAEVAQIVAFLVSERASYMTGSTIDVSGGMLMR
jgi:3-oxoacyl-[acyl-carrier protein] reductase